LLCVCVPISKDGQVTDVADSYKNQLADAPNEPPLVVNVVDAPLQMVLNVGVNEVAAVLGVELTVIVTLWHAVVLQSPSALTKYCVLPIGFTVKLPVIFCSSNVPPQLTLYNLHCAPVPNEPPLTFRFTDAPVHILFVLDVSELGTVEFVFTVTVVETHKVFPQVASYRAKYCVVVDGAAITKLLPEPMALPEPQPPAYHVSTPPVPGVPPVMLKVILATEPEQKLFWSELALAGDTGSVFTTMVALPLITVVQPAATAYIV
jgi:hypothetical protein